MTLTIKVAKIDATMSVDGVTVAEYHSDGGQIAIDTTQKVKLTAFERRALSIIRDNQIESAKQFAKLLWPDSPTWSASSRRRGGLYRLAGSWQTKLKNKGVISVYYKKTMTVLAITPHGRALLVEYKRPVKEAK